MSVLRVGVVLVALWVYLVVLTLSGVAVIATGEGGHPATGFHVTFGPSQPVIIHTAGQTFRIVT